MSRVLRSQEAQERSHVGRGRRHRPRGVRRAGGRCQGGVDPVVGSAGLDAHRGVARPGSDRAGWRSLRPQSPVSRRAPSWQQPRDGRVGRPARADSRAPDSPCHGARDSTAVVRGAAWRSRSQRPVAEARAVRDLVPQLRRRPPRRFPGRSAYRGRRCPARSFRPARRNSASSRSGTSPGRTSWPSCWTARRSPRRRWSSRWASR